MFKMQRAINPSYTLTPDSRLPELRQLTPDVINHRVKVFDKWLYLH